MEEWDVLMEGKTFITDLGADREAELEEGPTLLGRYAVWSPLQGGRGHAIVEVGRDLEALMERYEIPTERVCVLNTEA